MAPTRPSDDFESSATKGDVDGRRPQGLLPVHERPRRLPDHDEGARTCRPAPRPRGSTSWQTAPAPGTACCWDFGNVTTDPTRYADMNTLFFGVAFWGKGAGHGPWFMADFEAGVWAGGSKVGDPGWGALNDAHPANNMQPVAEGALCHGHPQDARRASGRLRAADMQKATDLTTAYEGAMPKQMEQRQGAVVLGVGGDNSNNSWRHLLRRRHRRGLSDGRHRPRRPAKHPGRRYGK